jgi:hypothetical protein
MPRPRCVPGGEHAGGGGGGGGGGRGQREEARVGGRASACPRSAQARVAAPTPSDHARGTPAVGDRPRGQL